MLKVPIIHEVLPFLPFTHVVSPFVSSMRQRSIFETLKIEEADRSECESEDVPLSEYDLAVIEAGQNVMRRDWHSVNGSYADEELIAEDAVQYKKAIFRHLVSVQPMNGPTGIVYIQDDSRPYLTADELRASYKKGEYGFGQVETAHDIKRMGSDINPAKFQFQFQKAVVSAKSTPVYHPKKFAYYTDMMIINTIASLAEAVPFSELSFDAPGTYVLCHADDAVRVRRLTGIIPHVREGFGHNVGRKILVSRKENEYAAPLVYAPYVPIIHSERTVGVHYDYKTRYGLIDNYSWRKHKVSPYSNELSHTCSHSFRAALPK